MHREQQNYNNRGGQELIEKCEVGITFSAEGAKRMQARADWNLVLKGCYLCVVEKESSDVGLIRIA